ncbi:MAG TPA: NAD(P)H-dependent oxidoreductase [Vicinamibacteria bacterium]|nr:NAD(P)H-dependent oxidoreductase [Vicinamibacteria bacterium]
MSRILLLFAHPALEKSRANRKLVERARGVPGVTFHDLYEAYPDFDVDVKREQALLLAHDTVVLQHPFYWYQAPALVKQWEDLVLEHGWAYGTGGTALRGTRLVSAVTTGGGEAAYRAEGPNRFTVRQLLAPIEQTARLCGMDYPPPFVVHGTHRLDAEGIARAAEEYALFLTALRDDRVDFETARELPRVNADLPGVLRPEPVASGGGDAR